ncbi:MAG TPA: family 2 glycosyl transferase [Candidatus Omnitrophica bacterium]|nr:family 2 glycosyl transferase [Candidatus Omnitrophota bacterium]
MSLFVERPDVSVIIASYRSQKTIRDCLVSLSQQSAAGRFEVIVVDSSNDGIAAPIVSEFTGVRLYTFPERKYCGDARNFGISVALADIVAFIDADCTADKNWIERIIEAHACGYVAVGGSIACRIPENYVGWAAYFTEFSKWMPAPTSSDMDDIAGANMSYKKKVFGEQGDFIEGTYCSDTEFHGRLKKAGYRLRFVPSIRVYHKNLGSFSEYIKHEFAHGRFFASVRRRSLEFSNMKRLLYGSFCFFIPLKLFLEMIGQHTKNTVYFSKFLSSLPLLMIGLFSWSLGEGAGYLTGVPDAR